MKKYLTKKNVIALAGIMVAATPVVALTYLARHALKAEQIMFKENLILVEDELVPIVEG